MYKKNNTKQLKWKYVRQLHFVQYLRKHFLIDNGKLIILILFAFLVTIPLRIKNCENKTV